MSGLWVLIMLILASSIPAMAIYLWFRIARYQFSAVRFLLILLVGATAFFPALILQNLFPWDLVLGDRWGLMGHMFIRIAFTEEFSRLLVLLVYLKISRWLDSTQLKSKETNSVTVQTDSEINQAQGCAVGLVAGLGLAILESAAYGAAGTGVILLRLFTAAPLHAACGARVGAAAVLLGFRPARSFFRFLTAVAIHGIYNYMIMLPGPFSLVAVLIAISALAS